MSAISAAGSAAASFVHQLRAAPPPAVPSDPDDDNGSATGAGSGSATGGQPISGQVGSSATGGRVNILA